MTDRRALVVGIDQYRHLEELPGCASDASGLADLLEDQPDATKWHVDRLSTSGASVSAGDVQAKLDALFAATDGDARDLLFYFSGHGVLKYGGSVGLQASDGEIFSLGEWLPGLSRITDTVRSITIILDCCFAGAVGDTATTFGTSLSAIPSKVAVLTASRSDQTAKQITREIGFEQHDESIFTTQLLNGLRGSAADLVGNITTLALYQHTIGLVAAARASYGIEDQIPMFKSNIDTPVVLRSVGAKITREILQQLPRIFEHGPDTELRLDMSYEGLTEAEFEELKKAAPAGTGDLDIVDPVTGANFRGVEGRPNFSGSERQRDNDYLKLFRDAGLLETEGDLYWAAVKNRKVRLSALGKYYWSLAKAEAKAGDAK